MPGLDSKTYKPDIEAEFCLELAKSGRSTCRNPKCLFTNPENGARTIAKGALRIGRMEVSWRVGRLVPKWVHLECCAPVVLQEAVDRYGGMEGVPGFCELVASEKILAVEIANKVLEEGMKEADVDEKKPVKKSSKTTKYRACKNKNKQKATTKRSKTKNTIAL